MKSSAVFIVLAMLIICSCLGLIMLEMDKTAQTAALTLPTPIPTLGPVVPLAAFNKALDTNAQTARDGFTAVSVAVLTGGAVEVSRNCSWGLLLLLGVVVIVVLFASGKQRS